MRVACESRDINKVRDLLLSAPTGYRPSSEIADLVWKKP
jgi:hypothetical protein